MEVLYRTPEAKYLKPNSNLRLRVPIKINSPVCLNFTHVDYVLGDPIKQRTINSHKSIVNIS